MQRLGDSTGLLRASLHSPTLEALSAPGRCVLCFHQSAVKWGQLRIKASEVAPDDTELYVVLLRTGTLSTAQSADILRVYQLARCDWLALRSVDTHYRVAQVSELRQAPESPPSAHQEPTARVECMLVEEEEEEKPSQFTAQSLQPLWPCESRVTTSPQSQGLIFYAASLCDFVALQGMISKQATPRLQKRWFQWLDRRYAHAHDDSQHQSLSYQFAATLARATLYSNDHRVLLYGHLDWALAREWLNLNCHLFAQQSLQSLELLFAEKLRQHTQWIQSCAHAGFYHRWQDYRLVNTTDYWHSSIHRNEQRVTINSLWLLQCDGLTEYKVLSAPGCISITRKQFQQQLLPLLYRLMLSDLLHLLRAEAMCLQSWTARQLWDRDSNWYWESAQAMQPLVQYKGEWPLLERYSRDCAQNHSSPVMRALLVQERMGEERRASLQSGQQRPQRVCEAVPDIEDLQRHAPPCMQRVMRQEWCKNDDRFNLVGWFYDAGYSQEQVIGFLCRHGDKEDGRETIKSLYQSCVKRPATKRHKAGRVSTTCGRVIDSEYGAGNVLRCPYEELRNGEQRRKHSALEKTTYGAECGAACGLGTVRHPLDFVEKKCGVARK